jgi:hypothetical protein
MPPKSNKGRGQVASITTTTYHKKPTPSKGRSASAGRSRSKSATRGRSRSRSQSRGRGRSASAGGTLAVVPQGRSRQTLIELEERKERTDGLKAIIAYAKAKYTRIHIKKKEKKEYSEADRDATRKTFMATIKAGAPLLYDIQKMLEMIKNGLTTNGTLNAVLIAKHLEDLITFTQKYAADESHDKEANQIVNKMRHITEQLRSNSVIFEANELGESAFKLYTDSFTSMSKTEPEREVRRYIWGLNTNTDKLAYASASTKFSDITKKPIFSDICDMIRDMKPTKEIEEWIQETHEKRWDKDQKIRDKKDKKIEARKLKSRGHETSQRDWESEIRAERRANTDTRRLLQDREILVAEDDGLPKRIPDGKQAELSTQELLAQMKSMQLAM